MRKEKTGVVVLALLLAACGSTTQQRAATGGLTGLGIGALAGGPVGALIGGAVGSVAGWVTPEGADTLALSVLQPTRQAGAGPSAAAAGSSATPAGVSGSSATPKAMASAASGQAASLPISPELAKHVQTVLKDQGFYDGPIDGIIGGRTQAALAAYQERQGLARSPVLDLATLQALAGAGMESSGAEPRAAAEPPPDTGAPKAEAAPTTGAAAATDAPGVPSEHR